jgi:hypothetical protein
MANKNHYLYLHMTLLAMQLPNLDTLVAYVVSDYRFLNTDS